MNIVTEMPYRTCQKEILVREFFSETTLTHFTIHCDVSLLNDVRIRSALDELIVAIKAMQEDGKPLFSMVLNSAGAIDLRLREEKPDREVKILRNRINSMMKDIMSRTSAA